VTALINNTIHNMWACEYCCIMQFAVFCQCGRPLICFITVGYTVAGYTARSETTSTCTC